MSWPTRKMTCIEWREIPMADPERERDVVKQEASGLADQEVPMY